MDTQGLLVSYPIPAEKKPKELIPSPMKVP